MKSMQKITLAVIACAMLGGSVPALAGAVTASVCRQRDVLDVAAQKIAERSFYARLLRDAVSETPTLAPDTVLCTATVKVTHYDTQRFGGRPQTGLEVSRFTVKRLDGGFEVSVP